MRSWIFGCWISQKSVYIETLFKNFLKICRAGEADVIVALLDSRNSDFIVENSQLFDSKKTIFAYSKSDLIHDRDTNETLRKEGIFISSFTGEGIDTLMAKIVNVALNK
jgi:hypothetical protein